MSEADWWLCRRCNSLNNLAARKCYSCQERKPKDAARASEVLEYVPEISWDGKVTFHGRSDTDPGPDSEMADAPSGPPPIREPVRRGILAVAPRLPHPATITYRLVEPSPPVPPAPRVPVRPTQAPGPPPRPPVPPTMPPPGEPGPPAWLREPPLSPQPPVVAVGPGQPPPEVPGQSETWPHWRELLDGPRPEADRLRSSPAADASGGAAEAAPGQGGRALNEAIRQARRTQAAQARSFIPWPASDRPAAGREEPDEPEQSLEADRDGRHE